jgi:hypothetical protein
MTIFLMNQVASEYVDECFGNHVIGGVCQTDYDGYLGVTGLHHRLTEVDPPGA